MPPSVSNVLSKITRPTSAMISVNFRPHARIVEEF